MFQSVPQTRAPPPPAADLFRRVHVGLQVSGQSAVGRGGFWPGSRDVMIPFLAGIGIGIGITSKRIGIGIGGSGSTTGIGSDGIELELELHTRNFKKCLKSESGSGSGNGIITSLPGSMSDSSEMSESFQRESNNWAYSSSGWAPEQSAKAK